MVHAAAAVSGLRNVQKLQGHSPAVRATAPAEAEAPLPTPCSFRVLLVLLVLLLLLLLLLMILQLLLLLPLFPLLLLLSLLLLLLLPLVLVCMPSLAKFSLSMCIHLIAKQSYKLQVTS
jgi:hypothetical protein